MRFASRRTRPVHFRRLKVLEEIPRLAATETAAELAEQVAEQIYDNALVSAGLLERVLQ